VVPKAVLLDRRDATSIHAPIPNQTVLLLSLSSVNYWAHRFRLC